MILVLFLGMKGVVEVVIVLLVSRVVSRCFIVRLFGVCWFCWL